MGPTRERASSGWPLALHLLHPERDHAWRGHHDKLLCWVLGRMEQDAADYRFRADADRRLHRRMDLFDLLGLAHPSEGHSRQG